MARILIVDDEQDILNTLPEVLNKWGHQTFVAANGIEGLKVFRENPLDFVITDIKMPQMDGLELLAHMRKNRPQVPCVVLTGSESPEIRNEADREYIFRYLQKPFDVNELFAVIIEGLDRLDEGLFWREYRKESDSF